MQYPIRRTLSVLIVTAATAFSVVHVLADDTSPNLSRVLQAQQSLAAAQPLDADVQNDLGNLLVLAGQLADAERAYQRAIDQRSGFVSAHFNLGLLLQQQGRPSDARTAFESVLDFDPAHAWARYQLGVVHDGRGDRRAAIQQYAHAFALDHRLAFAKHNPHVIDNQLLTQALLEARKFKAPLSAQAPRQYGDPERIADLLLDDGERVAAATPPMADSDTGEAQAVARDTEAMDSEDDEDDSDEFFDDEGTGADDDGAGRVLSAEDLDAGSRVGQAGTDHSSRSDARNRRGPGSVLERYRRTSRTPTGAGGENSGRSGGATLPSGATRGRTAAGRNGTVSAEGRSAAAGVGGARTRFTPSVRSSGSLDLQLRPISPNTDPVGSAAVATR